MRTTGVPAPVVSAIASGPAAADVVAPFLSFAEGGPFRVTPEPDGFTVRPPYGAPLRWTLTGGAASATPTLSPDTAARPDAGVTLAAIDAAFAHRPDAPALSLDLSPATDARVLDELTVAGVAAGEGGPATVHQETFFQQAGIWLAAPGRPYPVRHVTAAGRRHPVRGPKPRGTVYRRHIPWLGATLTLRTVDPGQDLDLFHRWMNDPFVARFWEEEGDLARHRAYLDANAADPHALGLIACFDGRPFGYVEAYWAREDRIAPFCDANDHDRGWHALVGEPAFRGRRFVAAWMPSVSHFLFLDDPRTRRIVIEPRADNDRMIRSLSTCGYALLKEFDFPHKRAVLGVLLRERFFFERLWVPRGGAVPRSPCIPS